MSKVGAHVIIGARNGWGDFVKGIVAAGQTLALVKCVDDFGAAYEAKAANPATLTIGRCNEGPGGQDLQGLDYLIRRGLTPAQGAEWYMSKIAARIQANPWIDVWELCNEWSGQWTWQADFYIAMLPLVEAMGKRVGLWSTSGGNPPLPDYTNLRERARRMWYTVQGLEQPWQAIARACHTAKSRANGHIFCGHEYAWDGLLKDSWGNGVVGRYQAIHQFLAENDAELPIAITECGENGGGGFVGVNRLIEDLSWCDQRWMADPYLLGIAFWTLGNWAGANFQAALPQLAEYIIVHPTPIEPPPVERMLEAIPHFLLSLNVVEDATLARGQAVITHSSDVEVRIVT